jgi:hypothetical protein
MTLPPADGGRISAGMSDNVFAWALPNVQAAQAPEAINVIAARVPQPRQLKAALEHYRLVQRQHTEATAELRNAISAVQHQGGEASTSAAPLISGVVTLEILQRELAGQVQAAIEKVIAARPPFTRAVTAALAPYRKPVARRALRGLAELTSALDILDQIDSEIAAAGGTPARALPQHRETLRPMTMRLAAMAGEISAHE